MLSYPGLLLIGNCFVLGSPLQCWRQGRVDLSVHLSLRASLSDSSKARMSPFLTGPLTLRTKVLLEVPMKLTLTWVMPPREPIIHNKYKRAVSIYHKISHPPTPQPLIFKDPVLMKLEWLLWVVRAGWLGRVKERGLCKLTSLANDFLHGSVHKFGIHDCFG